MAKKKAQPAPRPLTQRQLSKAKREKRRTQIATAVIGGLIGVAVLVLTVGAYVQYVGKPNSAVAKVNDQTISRATYEKRRKYDLNQQIQMAGIYAQQDPTGQNSAIYTQQAQTAQEELKNVRNYPVAPETLDPMIQALIIEQKAGSLGVTVTPADVDAEIQKQLDQANASRYPNQQPTEQATASSERGWCCRPPEPCSAPQSPPDPRQTSPSVLERPYDRLHIPDIL